MIKRYTKGDKDKVLTRVEQVSDITIHIPTSDRCMDYLYDGLMMLCNHYVADSDGDIFLMIPAIDFYNVVLFASKCCSEKEVDTQYISAMLGVVRTFTNLKYISVVFKDDIELRDSYDRLINMDTNDATNDIIAELTNLYTIDALELYLGDMLDQDIVDLINKHFIANEIISNSYLDRDFFIDFDFEEYVSYINMFINNNKDKLNMYDSDIIDYLSVFPTIIGDFSNPIIKVYTNYSEV